MVGNIGVGPQSPIEGPSSKTSAGPKTTADKLPSTEDVSHDLKTSQKTSSDIEGLQKGLLESVSGVPGMREVNSAKLAPITHEVAEATAKMISEESATLPKVAVTAISLAVLPKQME